jgi:hypothetical protein
LQKRLSGSENCRNSKQSGESGKVWITQFDDSPLENEFGLPTHDVGFTDERHRVLPEVAARQEQLRKIHREGGGGVGTTEIGRS